MSYVRSLVAHWYKTHALNHIKNSWTVQERGTAIMIPFMHPSCSVLVKCHIWIGERNEMCHAGCCKETTDVTTLLKLKMRYENFLPTGEAPILPTKCGPPLSTSTEIPSSSGGNEQISKYHRSSATKSNKELRFFCQEGDKTVMSGH